MGRWQVKEAGEPQDEQISPAHQKLKSLQSGLTWLSHEHCPDGPSNLSVSRLQPRTGSPHANEGTEHACQGQGRGEDPSVGQVRLPGQPQLISS